MMNFLVSLDGLDGDAVEYVEAIQAAIAKGLKELELPDATVNPTAIHVILEGGLRPASEPPKKKAVKRLLADVPMPTLAPDIDWSAPAGPPNARLSGVGEMPQAFVEALNETRQLVQQGRLYRPTASAPRRGEPWTPEEDTQLRTEWGGLAPEELPRVVRDIAAAHGRTRYSIEQRLVHLDLVPRQAVVQRYRGY